ncbi:MAG: thiamine-monophosphate kinase [Spirochaetales bacterium]|nr:thiamine-monophosphate kinase [Spirochaetales bacterium]
MEDEKATIKLIEKVIPRSPLLANRLFESDAEIFSIDGTPLLFTMDEFSHEDHFRESDPVTLGTNLAVGSISDILACGGSPLFYAHTIGIPPHWDTSFVRQFSAGVNRVLKTSGAGFIGGDLGRSETWHYTAAVIGKAEGKPLQRKGAQPGDAIYMTGTVGGGNLEAALCLYGGQCGTSHMARTLVQIIPNQFVLRITESRLIREHASSCIDTSDGVCNALNEIAWINNTGYCLDCLPYNEKGKLLACVLSLPVELLFLGECGEYELLFTIPEGEEAAFLARAKLQKLSFSRIGRIVEAPEKIMITGHGRGGHRFDLSGFGIRARDYESGIEYLEALVKWLEGWRISGRN